MLTKSYAKINLGLQVVRRRPDGYHEIRTGFVFINWYDLLRIERAETTVLRCNREDVPVDESNLVLKALDRLRKATGKPLHYRIQLSKNIPMGAGLGGGSSNAAALLRLVNADAGLGLSVDELARIGAGLGADVPVFVHGRPALASGIGEVLAFDDGLQPDAHIVTVFPGTFSSTAEAYAGCEPADEPEFDPARVLREPVEDWPIALRNDLEPPVMARIPLIGDLKDQLYDMGADYAAMSGSGSAVFGIFGSEHAAAEAFEYLRQEGYAGSLTAPGFKPDHRIQ